MILQDFGQNTKEQKKRTQLNKSKNKEKLQPMFQRIRKM